MYYISNSFSFSMLVDRSADIRSSVITTEEAADFARSAKSVVGHADIAAVMSNDLGLTVSFNRETIRLEAGDALLLGQYIGERLPEGCTILPAGSKIEYILVLIEPPTWKRLTAELGKEKFAEMYFQEALKMPFEVGCDPFDWGLLAGNTPLTKKWFDELSHICMRGCLEIGGRIPIDPYPESKTREELEESLLGICAPEVKKWIAE